MAYESVREQFNVAKIFLSENSISILDELISEHWHIKEHGASCTQEYLALSFEISGKAYESILQDAHHDLKKSRYSIDDSEDIR